MKTIVLIKDESNKYYNKIGYVDSYIYDITVGVLAVVVLPNVSEITCVELQYLIVLDAPASKDYNKIFFN